MRMTRLAAILALERCPMTIRVKSFDEQTIDIAGATELSEFFARGQQREDTL
jgi:hypothetical protein